jgi:uncharacterized protein YggE
MRKAVTRARADADAIADAAGGRISGVISISAHPGSADPIVPQMVSTMAVRGLQKLDTPTPIESGVLKVIVSIEARFTLTLR